MVRRVDFDDIDSLLELSIDAEFTIEVEKSYRESPPPEQSPVPEAVYQPQITKEKQTPLKVSAFPVSNPPVPEGEGQSWLSVQNAHSRGEAGTPADAEQCTVRSASSEIFLSQKEKEGSRRREK